MKVFTSIYGVVDGFFVSNFAGKVPFTAINFIMPFLMILGSLGFMFGTGGGALIAKTLGEGKADRARRIFSLIVYLSAACGIVLALLGQFFLRPIAAALGAEGQMLRDSVTYGRIILISIPAYILQYEFQCLFAVAEKPKLGLYVTIAAGCTNIVLDGIFVAVFGWGLEGAAAATAISECVGGVVPLIYFARPNGSLLRLGKTRFDGRALGKACVKGSSELMSNISTSIVSMLYNVQLLKYAGEDGGAAYGGSHVCEFRVYGNLYWLFHGNGSDHRISLWCGESWGTERVVAEEPFGGGRICSCHVCCGICFGPSPLPCVCGV